MGILDEELRREEVILNVGIRDANGVGCDEHYWVNLDEGGL